MHARRNRPLGFIFTSALVWLLAVGVAAALAGPQKPKGAQAPPAGQVAATAQAGYAGQDTCLTCHSDMGKVYGATPHGRAKDPRSPAANQGCESCHGPGKAHADAGGDKTKIKSFKAMAVAQVNETCGTCHNRGTHADWAGSMHDRHGLSCTTCHSIHHFKSETAQLKTVAEIDTCATCHRTEALKTRQISHMPVREGKMSCSSCHNPHGSGSNVRMLRAGNSVQEACTSCHAAQRGPYLWEHAPVRESCTTCHDPHGSNNDRMLVARMPMLCQRCHVSTRHPSTIYDYSFVGSASGSQNRLVNRSCINCHQSIHGSNHPGGVHFLR